MSFFSPPRESSVFSLIHSLTHLIDQIKSVFSGTKPLDSNILANHISVSVLYLKNVDDNDIHVNKLVKWSPENNPYK